jgi:hypothetical protein
LHIFRLHDPREYVYSDMKMYVDLAKRIARPGYELQIGDVTHPPGMTEIIAFFHTRDASLQQLVWFQFVVTALVPLAAGLFAWAAFDKTAGRLGVVVTALYYPFIDFGGYFLAEIYLALTATLAFGLYFASLRVASPSGEANAASAKRLAIGVGVALLGGLVLSFAMAMKMVAMPAFVGFAFVHLAFTRGYGRKLKATMLAAMIVASVPLTTWGVQRCTKANGRFCMGSNKAPSDFLLGHYGRIQGITWKEPGAKGHVGFGSPAAYQHGYRDKPEVPFKITDVEKNNAYAWAWIRKHPREMLVLSVEHAWDIFGGSLTWPAVATSWWAGSQAANYGFLAFAFFPTLVLLLDLARGRGLKGLLVSTELAVLAPMFGVLASVIVATGEVRYRIPWDASFLLLGVEFFRRLKLRWSEPDSTTSEVTAATDATDAPAEASEAPVDEGAPGETATSNAG